MTMISQSEYYAEVCAVAQAVLTESRDESRDVQDVLFEAVDGHQWIIYTFYNLQVLTHSRNDAAYFDSFGPLDASGFSDAVQKMAYAAFEQDVQDAIAELQNESEEA